MHKFTSLPPLKPKVRFRLTRHGLRVKVHFTVHPERIPSKAILNAYANQLTLNCQKVCQQKEAKKKPYKAPVYKDGKNRAPKDEQ